MRAVSAKRRREAAARKKVREITAERAGHQCELVGRVDGVECSPSWLPLEVDERVNRSQHPGAHLHPALTQYLCHNHHAWKTTHPDEARALGVRLLSWEVPVENSKIVPRPEARETAVPIRFAMSRMYVDREVLTYTNPVGSTHNHGRLIEVRAVAGDRYAVTVQRDGAEARTWNASADDTLILGAA